MQLSETTLFFILLAVAASILIGYFQYYFKESSTGKHTIYLLILRILGVFTLFLALINPKFVFESFEAEKPTLNLLVDNSKSIKKLQQEKSIDIALNSFLNHEELNNKFSINTFQFSDAFTILDSLSFDQSQTNISNALKQIDQLKSEKNQATILLSDGNQTVGFDYKNYPIKHEFYPLVFGDTTVYNDVYISQLNVNKYSYLGNEFPVEVFISSNKNQNAKVNVVVRKENKIVSKKRISINSNTSKRINFNLKSKKKGNAFYSAEVSPLANEKNIANNKRTFSIEVIDQKAKVLIVSSIIHPDLGSLKRSIESNKKRAVEIKKPNEVKDLNDYQAIVLHQPTANFKTLFNIIKTNEKNIFIINGVHTDYQFLNNQNLGFRKNYINDFEKATPIFNGSFLPFQQDDIGFDELPPLSDIFGEIVFTEKHNDLLRQRVNGIPNNQALLTSLTLDDNKIMVLFGEGIWRWRAKSYLKQNSFEDYDSFIGNIIQFVANKKKRDRLEVEIKPTHFANESIAFKAYFFDENYQFDENAKLELQLVNQSTSEKRVFPFSKNRNHYQVSINDLNSGTYNYSVTEIRTNNHKKGIIKVLESEIEDQFESANVKDLKQLANNLSSQLFYSGQEQDLIKKLVDHPNLKVVQKSIKKEKSIIDWWQYLILIILFFSSEWLIRKYHGRI